MLSYNHFLNQTDKFLLFYIQKVLFHHMGGDAHIHLHVPLWFTIFSLQNVLRFSNVLISKCSCEIFFAISLIDVLKIRS
jgi:uncharacterized membrane protein (DUF373 family)